MKTDRLCLGTVQFGLNYGINNRRGKPSKDEVFAMLDKAVDSGISCIDTAAAYGNAEELLGEYGMARKDVKVVSKLKPNLIDEKCLDPEKLIEDQIKGSLKRLKMDVLDGYLLHTPENFYDERVVQGLMKCREKGLIRHLGVSVYETQQALDVVKSGLVDYIQIPFNVFDQRLNKTDFFKIARENNVTVFARSAFLQGLILMEEERIPEYLAIAKQYLRDFDQVIEKYGFSRTQAALLFSYTNPDIDYVVFGVDDIKQLTENIDISRSNVDFQECRGELVCYFENVSKKIIFPSLWAKAETGYTREA